MKIALKNRLWLGSWPKSSDWEASQPLSQVCDGRDKYNLGKTHPNTEQGWSGGHSSHCLCSVLSGHRICSTSNETGEKRFQRQQEKGMILAAVHIHILTSYYYWELKIDRLN